MCRDRFRICVNEVTFCLQESPFSPLSLDSDKGLVRRRSPDEVIVTRCIMKINSSVNFIKRFSSLYSSHLSRSISW